MSLSRGRSGQWACWCDLNAVVVELGAVVGLVEGVVVVLVVGVVGKTEGVAG